MQAAEQGKLEAERVARMEQAAKEAAEKKLASQATATQAKLLDLDELQNQ